MVKNIGLIDKSIRLIIGTAILVYGVSEQSLFGIIGLVLIVTALIEWCPLYTLIGKSSCTVKKNDEEL